MRGLLVSLWLAAAPNLTQAQAVACAGAPPEPSWLARGPVSRNCEVDHPASPVGKAPDLRRAFFEGLRPSDRCLEATFEFVVDAEGLVDTTRVRLRESTSAAATLAVRTSLSELRFAPAQRADSAVAQLVVYRRGVTYGAPARGTTAFSVGRVTMEELQRGVALGPGGRPISISDCDEGA